MTSEHMSSSSSSTPQFPSHDLIKLYFLPLPKMYNSPDKPLSLLALSKAKKCMCSDTMNQSAQSTVTKYQQIGWLNSRNFLTTLETKRSISKYRPIWFLMRALFPSCRWWPFLHVLTWIFFTWRDVSSSSHKATNLIGLGSQHISSFNLNCLHKSPIPKYNLKRNQGSNIRAWWGTQIRSPQNTLTFLRLALKRFCSFCFQPLKTFPL